MIITPVRTDRIRPSTLTILEVIDKFLPSIEDGSVIAVTSKIVSICEGRLVPFGSATIEDLIKQESDLYLTAEQYERKLTITRNILIPKAGIDNSPHNESYILWPRDPQRSADEIREFIKNKTGHTNIGVILTDSTTAPLVRGVRGISIAHSGFLATKKNKTEVRANVVEGLAAAAVVVMGEGAEQTPIAVIDDLPFVDFVEAPNAQESELLHLDLKEDIYGSLLTGVDWHQGDRGDAEDV